VWSRRVDGRVLTFRLAGINNQNFLMRDEETGTFWQQISGKAVSGPMRGRQLELVPSDELTFGLWRQEHPSGSVLAPEKKYAKEYEAKDWEAEYTKLPSVVDTTKTGRKPRELILGVEINGNARAYLLERVLKAGVVEDTVAGTPLIVVTGPDKKSTRVFDARIPGEAEPAADFYRGTGSDAAFLMDSATGSGWNFQGCAISGPATAKCLRQINAIRDYWFDWQLYHPKTTVHAR
jgi:hypothetical protein